MARWAGSGLHFSLHQPLMPWFKNNLHNLHSGPGGGWGGDRGRQLHPASPKESRDIHQWRNQPLLPLREAGTQFTTEKLNFSQLMYKRQNLKKMQFQKYFCRPHKRAGYMKIIYIQCLEFSFFITLLKYFNTKISINMFNSEIHTT